MSIKKHGIGKIAFSFLVILSIEFSGFSLPKIGKTVISTKAAAKAYTWNNTIPVKSPKAGAKNNHKLVLFDNTHDNTAGQADWVIDGGFSDFADALVNEGYTVEEYRGVDKNGDGAIRFYDDRNLPADEEGTAEDKNEAIITYDAIKDADVFITAESNRPMRKSEYAALKKFVDAGKGVYFIGDHYNGDRDLNTWDSTEVYDGYNRCTNGSYNMGGVYGDLRNPDDASKGWLSENFGVRFRFNAGDSNPQNGQSGPTDIRPANETEGLTDGVVGQKILMAAGSTISITDSSKAKGIVYFHDSDSLVPWSSGVENSHGGKSIYFGGEKEGAFVAISKPSNGRAAFLGDSSPVEDSTSKYLNATNGKSKTGYNGWTDLGNAAKLSINIVNWLADSSQSYVGFGSTDHPKDIYGNTPVPMADVEKSDPDNGNPWSQPSGGYDPWNTDTWAAGSYGAPYAATQNTAYKLSIYPKYVYLNEPFAINITGTGSSLKLGAYINSGAQNGTQVAQIYDKTNDTWSQKGYTGITGSTPTTVTAKIAQLPTDATGQNISIRIKDGSTNGDTQKVTGISSGYGYISGSVDANSGDIAVATQGSDIIGTAQVDDSKNVKIACITGSNINLSLYNSQGIKQSDLSGTYSVSDGQTTAISVPKSSNANLKSLSLASGENNITLSPAFSSAVTEYTAEIDNSINTANISIAAEDSKATATINGKAVVDGKASVDNIAVGNNTISIVVTAEDGSTKNYTITLTRDILHVSSVKLDENSIEMLSGDSHKLSYNIFPANADKKDVKWTSSNTDVATVDAEGNVKAVGLGNAAITIETLDGAFKDTCTVKVTYNSAVEITNSPGDIQSAIANSNSGTTINVNSESNPIVDSSIFSAISGEDKTIVFKQNNAEWSFSGKDISETAKNIDLTTSISKIDSSTSEDAKDILNKLEDDNSILIKFADNGVLPGKATVKLLLGSDYANKKGLYLFYYNPSTKSLEKLSNAINVDSDGWAVIQIVHCSEYVLSTNDVKASTSTDTTTNTGNNNNTQNISAQASASGSSSLPKTGAIIDDKVLGAAGVILIILGGILIFRKKKGNLE